MLLEEYLGETLVFSLNGESQKVSYSTRVDPLSGNVAKLSEIRAKRNIGISFELNLRPVENCDFCSYLQRTPNERIEHACGAISVPNKFPWEKYDWITIYPPFAPHKLLLSDLYFDDLERMIQSSYDLGMVCAKDPDVVSFMDFTNWGVFAGASQQHPHSQRKSSTHVSSPIIHTEMERCHELWERFGKNPFQMLEQEERSDGRRVIHDGNIFIVSAFAPTCPDEILVFPKEDIAHIIQTSEFDRRRIIQPVLGIFPALFFCRGVTDLNIAVHMATFAEMEEARKYYRWHMHIYPRRARLPSDRAGAEIGFGTEVIDAMPEVTAELLRQWYRHGPGENLVLQSSDGYSNRRLMEEFRRFMSNCR